MNLAVTDTHALVWWAIGPERKLGAGARRVFARAERGEATIYVPVVSLVEIAEAMRRGTLRSGQGFSRWTERMLASGRFIAADLTPAIVLEAESFYAIPERGDRLVAATAVHLECPLITRDPAMAGVWGLTTIW